MSIWPAVCVPLEAYGSPNVWSRKSIPRDGSVCMSFREVGFRGSITWYGRLRGQPGSHRLKIEVIEKTFQVGSIEKQERRGWWVETGRVGKAPLPEVYR